MATEHPTAANIHDEIDPLNQAEADIRELHALGDLLMQVDGADLDETTVSVVGSMIYNRTLRLAENVRVLAEPPAA
jgi:hypothetical protein